MRSGWPSAERSEPNDANALALATVDADGLPNVRMVLLKGFDPAGFVFYTNFDSAKGREILATGKAAMCFHWKSLRRQVRLRGAVEVVSRRRRRRLFPVAAARQPHRRLGVEAVAPLESRFALEKSVAEYTARYALGEIPRPAHWSGFRLVPQAIEFWHDRPFRLHDRLRFTRNDDGGWTRTRLYP